jgi:Na+-transporting methylmalonyl-CoA/oxaloacetate decarboxylase gamma subunit
MMDGMNNGMNNGWGMGYGYVVIGLVVLVFIIWLVVRLVNKNNKIHLVIFEKKPEERNFFNFFRIEN